MHAISIKEVQRRVDTSYSQKNQWRPTQDMEEQRATNPTEEKTCTVMIWPMMTYRSETWIYLKSVQNMINVFERWCYRRMLRISCAEHVTSEEVFNMANLFDGLYLRGDFPWSPSGERRHHIRPHEWTHLHGTRPR